MGGGWGSQDVVFIVSQSLLTDSYIIVVSPQVQPLNCSAFVGGP